MDAKDGKQTPLLYASIEFLNAPSPYLPLGKY